MIRSVVLIVWAVIIFLFTCTESMEQLLQHGVITFHWSSHPKMNEFMYPLPTDLDGAFISRKMGHAMSFFFLSILFYFNFISIKKMVVFSFIYAAFTEVLQLYFQRGGRLFDIGFDGMGIIFAFIIVFSQSFNNEKSLTRRRSQT